MNKIEKMIRSAWKKSEFLILKRKLSRFPRYTPGTIRFRNWTIDFVDAASLVTMIQLQVLNSYNDFVCDKLNPLILDCGANIGISVLRYKQLYPDARIIAFEPDPKVCEVLRRNLVQNQITQVTVIEAAIWIEEGTLSFIHEGSDSGHIIQKQRREGQEISVRAVDLKQYLHEPVDFLKVDIEGAELTVLSSCEPLLRNVDKAIVEVHYWVDKPNILSEMINVLHRAGFNVAINSLVSQISLRRPYIRRTNVSGDQFPVLYAWR